MAPMIAALHPIPAGTISTGAVPANCGCGVMPHLEPWPA